MGDRQNWITIAPIRGLDELPANVGLPFYFDDRTRIDFLPKWVHDNSDPAPDQLLPRLRQEANEFGGQYCFIVQYEADSLGMPDPDWSAENRRPIQNAAVERINIACLSLWLACPSELSFRRVAHVSQVIEEILVHQYNEYDQIRALSRYSRLKFNRRHFPWAIELYRSIFDLPHEKTIHLSVWLLLTALVQSTWHIRFLNLWLTLECLFGPRDARETTYRISQRIGIFLGANKSQARQIFNIVKKSYSWRSKTVHGLRLSKLKPQESEILLEKLERIVRHSLLRILNDRELIQIFDGKDRENYLDDLVFR